MIFDYIIGNPPFQDTFDKSKGRKLYLDITEKMLQIYGTEINFITPVTIAKDKKKRLSLKNIKGIKEVDYTVDNYFNVGVPILKFLVQKNYSGNVKVKDSIIEYRNLGESLVKSNEKVPMKLFEKIKSIGSLQKDKLFIGDVTSYKNSSKIESDNFKYKVHLNYLKNKIIYSSIEPKLFRMKKIVIHMGRTYNSDNFLISTDNFGQYQNMICIEKYTDKQIQNIKDFLFNDLIIKIVKKFREFYNTGFNNIIYFFPKIDINKQYSEEDIIKLFSIIDIELNYLKDN